MRDLCCDMASIFLFSKRDYEIRSLAPQFLFSLTFALSSSLFELVIFEIAGVLSNDARWLNWKVDLILLLAILIIVLPLYTSILFAQLQNWHSFLKHENFQVNLFLSGVVFSSLLVLANMSLFLYLFWSIGESFPIVRYINIFFASFYNDCVFESRRWFVGAMRCSCWRSWCHCDFHSLRIWCCQLPVFNHVGFYEVC